MAQARKYKVERIANELVEEATRLGDPVKFMFHKEKKMSDRWSTTLYAKVKNDIGMQIGGQTPGSGGDILKYIQQHDPNNSGGVDKDAVKTMMKLQQATESKSLFTSIQPLQSILGGQLYGAMQSAGAAAKASGKAKKKKKQKDENGEEVIVEEEMEIIAELIAAAMAMLTPDDAVLVAELLDDNEVAKIEAAYYGNGVYSSTIMPVAFVTAINALIPTFRATKGMV